ncbi:MAG: ornithine cyclodeaminase family protein [bacterium]
MLTSHILSAADITAIVADVGLDALMDDTIATLADTLTHYDPRHHMTPPRDGFSYRHPTTGLLEWMPTLEHGRSISVKTVGYHPENPREQDLPTILSTIVTFDTNTGHLLGIADATFLTALRTGAASAVATRLLASPRSRRLGLLGVGAQAVTQLHAISRVLPLEEVLIYDTDSDALESFARRIAPVGLDRLPLRVADPQEMVSTVDVLCAATSVEVGGGPVFRDTEVRPWLHINGVGSDFPGKTELPHSLLERAFVVPDFLEQAVREGECQQLRPDEIGPDLVTLLRDPKRFAAAREQISVFDSTGWALEDHLAFQILRGHAERLGLGQSVRIERITEDPRDPYGAESARHVVPIRPRNRRTAS